MNNLALAAEKLESARIVLLAAGNYQDTASRLLAESSKLIDEAEKLIEGVKHGTNDQGQRQGQPRAPHARGSAEALPGCLSNDASAQG